MQRRDDRRQDGHGLLGRRAVGCNESATSVAPRDMHSCFPGRMQACDPGVDAHPRAQAWHGLSLMADVNLPGEPVRRSSPGQRMKHSVVGEKRCPTGLPRRRSTHRRCDAGGAERGQSLDTGFEAARHARSSRRQRALRGLRRSAARAHSAVLPQPPRRRGRCRSRVIGECSGERLALLVGEVRDVELVPGGDDRDPSISSSSVRGVRNRAIASSIASGFGA